MSFPRDLLRKRGDASTPDGGGALARYARALVNDLVDKNLWPVALLLCVAIVAIPVLLSRGAGSDGAAGVPVAAPPADVDVTNLFERVGPPTVTNRHSKQQDPFRQPGKKKETAAGGAIPLGVDAPSAAAPSAAAPSGSAPSGSSKGPMASAVNAATVYYRTEVRWSEGGGGAARPISRLTPLGDVGQRGVLYLGVSNLGYAMFLLSPNVQAEVSTEERAGKVGCEADEPNCRIVGLKAGTTQVVIVPSSDASKARRYHLEAVSVKRVVTSVAAARTMRAKVHSEGRAIMREMWSDPLTGQVLGMIRYDEASGLLVLVNGATKTTK